MDLGSILTMVTIAEKAKGLGLFNWFTGMSHGTQLKSMLPEFERMKVDIRRLNDRVLWAPSVHQAINQTPTRQQYDRTAQDIVDSLDASSSAIQSDILVTAVSSTPDRLRTAFAHDPFEVLIDCRPAHRSKRPSDPDLIPVMFSDGAQQYIGWQKKGALPAMFDCDFKAVAMPEAAPPTPRPTPRPATRSRPNTQAGIKAGMRRLEVSHFYVNDIYRPRFMLGSLFGSESTKNHLHDQLFTPAAIEVFPHGISIYLDPQSSEPWQTIAVSQFVRLATGNRDRFNSISSFRFSKDWGFDAHLMPLAKSVVNHCFDLSAGRPSDREAFSDWAKEHARPWFDQLKIQD